MRLAPTAAAAAAGCRGMMTSETGRHPGTLLSGGGGDSDEGRCGLPRASRHRKEPQVFTARRIKRPVLTSTTVLEVVRQGIVALHRPDRVRIRLPRVRDRVVSCVRCDPHESRDGFRSRPRQMYDGGACVKACPKMIIELRKKWPKNWRCMSRRRTRALVMKACKAGCIGCGKCQKVCSVRCHHH